MKHPGPFEHTGYLYTSIPLFILAQDVEIPSEKGEE